MVKLPLPYLGMHPEALRLLGNEPSDRMLGTEPMLTPGFKAARTRVIKTEPLNRKKIEGPLSILENLSPHGSINTIFLTNGNRTMWRNFPLASMFASDPHQMSIAASVPNSVPGLNMFLFTTEPSTTVPQQWKTEFPGLSSGDPEQHTLSWMALHQVGHSMGTQSWEYMDRSYALMTPQDLIDMTHIRMDCLQTWFGQYAEQYGDTIEPDSMSYLYEVKVIQRALWLANQFDMTELPPLSPPSWFQGFHIQEVLGALGMEAREAEVLNATRFMDDYVSESLGNGFFHPLINSATFGTDYGTHPLEEISVNALALDSIGELPLYLDYWKSHTRNVRGIWERGIKNLRQ